MIADGEILSGDAGRHGAAKVMREPELPSLGEADGSQSQQREDGGEARLPDGAWQHNPCEQEDNEEESVNQGRGRSDRGEHGNQ